MNLQTASVVAVVLILALFAAWALLPAMTQHRQRILKSPATWAVVVLALSFLWLKWEERAFAEREKNAEIVFEANMNLATYQEMKMATAKNQASKVRTDAVLRATNNE